MLELLQLIEEVVSPIVVHALELIGIFMIVFGSVKALIIFFKSGMDVNNSLGKIILSVRIQCLCVHTLCLIDSL